MAYEAVSEGSLSPKLTFYRTSELVKTSSQAGLAKKATSVCLDMWFSDGLGSAKSQRKLIWVKGRSVFLFSVQIFFLKDQ